MTNPEAAPASVPVSEGAESGSIVGLSRRWRTGRKVGRTLYAQQGDRPRDSDPLIGVMDSPELAERAVTAVNAAELSDIPADDVVTYLSQSLVRRGWSTDSAKQYAKAATEVLALRYRMEAK